MTERYVPLLAPIAGCGLGVLFALISLAMMKGVSDEILLAGYAIVVFLVSASLMSSAKWGFMFALATIAAEAVTELIYIVSVYRMDLSLLPFAAGLVLFIGRIPLFLLAGLLGGYLGSEWSTERRTKKRRGAEKATKRVRR